MKIIKLAIRSILNFRTYSGINLLGLALSLACVITIFRYVYGEFTVDRFNKKLDRIFIATVEVSENPGEIRITSVDKYSKDASFVNLNEHPGVERYSNFAFFDNDEIDFDNRKYDVAVLMADSNFLKITDYPIISGMNNLSEPNTVLITKNFAQKLFGKQNPVGNTFRHSSGEILTITGVIGQTSTKSTLSFDFIVSYFLPSSPSKVRTLVMLYPNIDYRTVNKQYEAFIEHRFWPVHMRYQLFPLSKVYFDKSIINDITFTKGNYSHVTVLMGVGFLILLTGIINFINIFTVVVLRRGRELGVKKVFGAGNHIIFSQLMVESMLITGLAIMLAFFIVKTTYPLVTNIIQLDQVPNVRFDILLSVILLLLLPLSTTLFPFFRQRNSLLVNSIRNFDKTRRSGSFHRIFLSFQFVITIVLIIVSLFFVKQFQFMLNTEPGYHTKNIIKVQFLKAPKVLQARTQEDFDKENQIADEIMQKMNACPLFSYWTYGESPNNLTKGGIKIGLMNEDFKDIKLIGVDERWLRLFNIQLKEGRLWDDETDVRENNLFIVSESAMKLFGITDFAETLLQPASRLWYGSGIISQEDAQNNPPYRIVGVVKDFDYLPLSQKSDPVVFHYSKGNRTNPLLASIVPGQTQDAIAFLSKLHEETAGSEFSYSFVEDEIREMYKGDKKIASIYSAFTLFAIFISVLGLLSISLFDLKQRRKEIAIRKINGASFSNIIRLLLKKYFWSLGISFVIATPVALFAINRYLEDFAHKATVSWWLFAAAITLTDGISLLTLIYQTQKASNQNPAETIKNND